MPIPNPKSEETEDQFVSRCIGEIYDEYGQEQSAAICYNTYRTETNMSVAKRIKSLLAQEQKYRGINLSQTNLEAPCWDGYEQYGTKELDGREVPNCIPIKE